MERVICQRPPNSIVSVIVCDVKYIKRGYLRFNVWGNLSEPLHDAWVHLVGYYKFNSITYQRFAVDLWDNGCDLLTQKATSIAFNMSLGRVLQYTNIKHPCPYEGHVYLKVDNISVNHFPFEELIPAGRYRIDGTLTDGTRKKELIKASVYLSVSDHRVERWRK